MLPPSVKAEEFCIVNFRKVRVWDVIRFGAAKIEDSGLAFKDENLWSLGISGSGF